MISRLKPMELNIIVWSQVSSLKLKLSVIVQSDINPSSPLTMLVTADSNCKLDLIAFLTYQLQKPGALLLWAQILYLQNIRNKDKSLWKMYKNNTNAWWKIQSCISWTWYRVEKCNLKCVLIHLKAYFMILFTRESVVK